MSEEGPQVRRAELVALLSLGTDLGHGPADGAHDQGVPVPLENRIRPVTCRRAGGDAVLLRLRYCVFSEASTSMTSWIFSPTTTPPVGSAMLAVMPQSVRLISPMADSPARVPP